jgi:hypothetical protein
MNLSHNYHVNEDIYPSNLSLCVQVVVLLVSTLFPLAKEDFNSLINFKPPNFQQITFHPEFSIIHHVFQNVVIDGFHTITWEFPCMDILLNTFKQWN